MKHGQNVDTNLDIVGLAGVDLATGLSRTFVVTGSPLAHPGHQVRRRHRLLRRSVHRGVDGLPEARQVIFALSGGSGLSVTLRAYDLLDRIGPDHP